MTAFNLTNAQALFKINYYKRSENAYNSANVTLGRVKKRYDFTGRSRSISTTLSYSGGVGSGSKPVANVGNYQEASISAKKVYAVCRLDRESIKASSDDKGAFVQATKETVQKCVESYNRNASRILYNDGSGILGKGDATGDAVTGAGTTANPYVVQIPLKPGITVGGWKEANWEERDFVQVVAGASATTGLGGTAEATLLEVSVVTASTRKISLVGTSARLAVLVAGALPLQTTDCIVMQKSYENDPQGIKGVCDATSGTLYGITVQRRWQAVQKDADGAGVTTDFMNEVMLDVHHKVGKSPDLIVASYIQYRKILNQLEDKKQYNVDPRSKDLVGKLSFKGVEFMSITGAVGVFPERFVDNDRVYFLNMDKIELHHRPGFGWFDDDGTVFLRASDGSDEYEATYGGYWQSYIEPPFHGVLHNLAS